MVTNDSYGFVGAAHAHVLVLSSYITEGSMLLRVHNSNGDPFHMNGITEEWFLLAIACLYSFGGLPWSGISPWQEDCWTLVAQVCVCV